MANIKHIIRLKKKERELLQRIVKDPSTPERAVLRANILLASDTGKKAQTKSIEEIIRLYKTNRMTVNRVRKSYEENGVEAAINGKKRKKPPVPAKVTREVEEEILEIFATHPPEGRHRWTLGLLARKAQEKGIVDSISTTRVRQILIKNGVDTSFYWPTGFDLG